MRDPQTTPTSDDAADKRSVIRNLVHVLNHNYYGNGSLNGQLGRLLAVWKVYGRAADARKPMSYKKLKPMLDRRYPILSYEEKYGKPNPFKTAPDDRIVTLILQAEKDGVKLININGNSDPGLLYRQGMTRTEVFTSDIMQARQLLSHLREFPVDDSFWKIWGFMRLTKLKPKAEVYEREVFRKEAAEKAGKEFLPKTRNINVMMSFAQLPAHILTYSTYRHNPTADMDPTNEVFSLMGFSSTHGGMTNLIEIAVDFARKGGTFIAVYADNFFVCESHDDKIIWGSLDGEKMEASISKDIVEIANRRVIDCGFDGEVPPEWKKYFISVHPSIGVMSIGVIGNQEVLSAGQSSGVVGTSANNATLCCIVGDALRRSGKKALIPNEGRDDFKISSDLAGFAADCGVFLRIERTTHLGNYRPGLSLYNLDMLGADGCRLTDYYGLNCFIPVLNYERLLKALGWDKKVRWGMEGKEKSVSQHYFRLVKLRTLYIFGGWFYSDLGDMMAATMRHDLEYLAANLLDRGMKADAIAAAVESVGAALMGILDPDWVEGGSFSPLTSILASPSVPAIGDVFKIMLTKDDLDTFVLQVLSDENSQPLEILGADLLVETIEKDDDKLVMVDVATLDRAIGIIESRISIRDVGETRADLEALLPAEQGLMSVSWYTDEKVTRPKLLGRHKDSVVASKDPLRRFYKPLKERKGPPDKIYREMNNHVKEIGLGKLLRRAKTEKMPVVVDLGNEFYDESYKESKLDKSGVAIGRLAEEISRKFDNRRKTALTYLNKFYSGLQWELLTPTDATKTYLLITGDPLKGKIRTGEGAKT